MRCHNKLTVSAGHSTRHGLCAAGLLMLAGLSLAGCAATGDRHTATRKDRTPAQSRLKYELALQHFENGRTSEAIATINEAIRAYPTSADQFLLLARCQIELGKFVSARDAAEEAKRCSPESTEADYMLGVIAERSNDPDSALEHFRRARSRGRGAVDYVVAEAECLTTLGHTAQAIALISEQIERFDSDGTLEWLLAQIHVLDGDIDTALREFAHALERSACDSVRMQNSRSCALLIEEYGELLASEGRYEQAIATLQPHVDVHGTAPASVIAALGAAYLEAGRVDEAQRLLAAQSKRHTTDAACWLLLARASIMSDDWVTARRTSDTMIRLVPDSSSAHLMRGFVYWKMNDKEEAIDSLERSLSIEPHDAGVECLLSRILQDAGYGTASADAHHRRAVEIDPQHTCRRDPDKVREWKRPGAPDTIPVMGTPVKEARRP